MLKFDRSQMLLVGIQRQASRTSQQFTNEGLKRLQYLYRGYPNDKIYDKHYGNRGGGAFLGFDVLDSTCPVSAGSRALL